MGKIIELSALVSLLFVFVCSIAFPRSSFLWLATASSTFTVLRMILITLIGTLLITRSFYDHHLHWLLGAFAITLSGWALYATYSNQLQILDGLSFLAAGLSLGLEALEPGVERAPAAEPVTLQQLRSEVKHKLAIYTLAAYVVTRSIALNHSPNNQLTMPGGHRPSPA
jgi:TctA family transporter